MAQLIATTVNGELTVNGNLVMNTNAITSVKNITSTGTITATSGDGGIVANKMNGLYITSGDGRNSTNSYFYYDDYNKTLYINIPKNK